MGVDPDRMMLFEHRGERVGDPVRQDHGGAGADANDLHMGDGAQLPQDPVEGLILQQQRIASGEKDVAHRLGPANVVDPRPDRLAPGDEIDIPHLALAGAMPAVHGAHVADLQQNPVGIAVRQSRNGAVLVLGQRIGHVRRVDHQFLGGGEGLLEDGVVAEVGGVDEGEVIGCDGERKLFEGLMQDFSFFFVKPYAQKIFKLIQAFDRMSELPLPIFPVRHQYPGIDLLGDAPLL